MKSRKFTPKGVKVKGKSRQSIRRDAHIVRDVFASQLELSRPVLPIVDILEWLDTEGIIQLDVLEQKEMGDTAAELQPIMHRLPVLYLNESVYELACNDDNFGRFTIAHELGHYFLHSNQWPAYARSQESTDHKAFEDSEWQANTFAGELLVDSRTVMQLCHSVNDVMHVYGVSRQTAEIQWEELRKDGLRH